VLDLIGDFWWAMQVSNLRPLQCEGSACNDTVTTALQYYNKLLQSHKGKESWNPFFVSGDSIKRTSKRATDYEQLQEIKPQLNQ
jgi:hypothetical protein